MMPIALGLLAAQTSYCTAFLTAAVLVGGTNAAFAALARPPAVGASAASQVGPARRASHQKPPTNV